MEHGIKGTKWGVRDTTKLEGPLNFENAIHDWGKGSPLVDALKDFGLTLQDVAEYHDSIKSWVQEDPSATARVKQMAQEVLAGDPQTPGAKMMQLEHAYNQKLLGDKVTLYRGLTGESTAGEPGSVQSWTDEKKYTYQFAEGARIESKEIPSKCVMSSYLTNSTLKDLGQEHEFIVAFPKADREGIIC